MTMNINTSPDQIVRSSAQLTPGYMSGFGNSFETEALPGALPMGRNSPQRCAYGLYAEQLSGSPFTAPRGSNERSWLYRIRPSVKHSGRFEKADAGLWRTAPCHEYELPIAQLRWDPAPIPKEDMTFLQGVQTMTTAGDANTQAGMAAHVYLITKSMVDQHFYNADGEMLILPQQGRARFVTELGVIETSPGEIALLPRGLRFRVELPDGPSRGYICENYGAPLRLPELGPGGPTFIEGGRCISGALGEYTKLWILAAGRWHFYYVHPSPRDFYRVTMPEAVPHLLHPGEMTVETLRQGLSYKVVLGLRCSEGPVRVLHLVGDVADVTRAVERDEDAPAGPLGWKLKMTHLISHGSFHGLIRLEDGRLVPITRDGGEDVFKSSWVHFSR